MDSSAIFLIIVHSAQCANILGVFMFPSLGHQIVQHSLCRELSLRGHQVTVITPTPFHDSTLTNLTEISIDFVYDIMKQRSIQTQDIGIYQKSINAFECFDSIIEIAMNSTQVLQLIGDQDRKFDLILMELMHPVLLGFGARFGAPSIGISTRPFQHPVLSSDQFLTPHIKPLSFWERFGSITYFLWSKFYYQWVFVPRAQRMATKYFGQVSYVDLEKNLSLCFLGVNSLILSQKPKTPAMMEIGPIHIQPPKPLPEDLQEVLDRAKTGVIYLSLGTEIKSIDIDQKLRTVMVEALGELPYTVLWKWESGRLPGKPNNVVTRKWFPQQDILAHPNIKAFVTQGGIQSTEEAIAREVPIIGMPFINDQPTTVQKLVDLGIAKRVDPATVTKTELKSVIIHVAESRRYKDRIKEVCSIMFDKPMSGLETAVWWSEYVIRHKDVRHLRSPTADSSRYHYFNDAVIVGLQLTGIVCVMRSRKLSAILKFHFCGLLLIYYFTP